MAKRVVGKDGVAQELRAVAPTRRVGQAPAHHLLGLQRSAGNRATSRAVALQRTSLAVPDGTTISSTDGPGTNVRADVQGVQDRLRGLSSLDAPGYDADRAKIAAKSPQDPVLAVDIPNTLAAIDRNEAAHLAPGAALGVFKAGLVDGVGLGQGNDGADVDLMLNLMHEESHVTNEQYDAGIRVLTGVGTTVDPTMVPGFLDGLTKLKRYYAAGYAFRGTMRTRTRTVLPDGPEQAAYTKAVEHNVAERQVMRTWIDEAANQTKDVVLRNSAQWILSGRSKIYCLTRTHDSAARVKEARAPKLIAWFSYPGGDLFSAPSLYVRKAKGQPAFNNADVKLDPDSAGFEFTGVVGVVEPSKGGKKFFLDTIRHETQHDADHTASDDKGLHTTELNARWVEKAFGRFSTRRKVKALGFTWNERQLAVFQELFDNPALYPYARKNWNDPNKTARDAWRAFVVGLRQPDTFNPINSIRIEQLWTVMALCTTAGCAADDKRVEAGNGNYSPPVQAVWDAMSALDDNDRTAIRSNADLNRRALENLGGRIRDAYFAPGGPR